MPRYARHRREMRHVRHDRHDPFSQIKTVGALQYSADGSTGWVAAIPAGTMKINTDIEFYVRVDPSKLSPADDGTYHYNFQLIGTLNSEGNYLDGIVDMNLTWSGPIARVWGNCNQDEQVGKTFKINAQVRDARGNIVEGTALTQDWIA